MNLQKQDMEQHQALLEAIDSEFYDQAKAAVIDKWLTYCYVTFQDRVMDWRTRVFQMDLSRYEQSVVLKLNLMQVRSLTKKQTQFLKNEDGVEELTQDYDSLGRRIDRMPALLDPQYDLQLARYIHVDQQYEPWEFKFDDDTPKNVWDRRPQKKKAGKSQASLAAVSSFGSLVSLTPEERKDQIRQMAYDYPVVISFVPTQDILHKLILKTAHFQSDDQVREHLNPREFRRRFYSFGQEIGQLWPQYDEIRMKPRKISYPDLQNYPAFFDETNLQFLCSRYRPDDYESVQE